MALTFDQKVKQYGAHQCYLPPFCTNDVKRVSHSNTLNVPLIVNKHKDKTNRGQATKMEASEIKDCERRRVIGERKREGPREKVSMRCVMQGGGCLSRWVLLRLICRVVTALV